VEINARLFEVKEFYLERVVENIMQDKEIEKTQQDKDLLLESMSLNESNKP